MIKIKGSKEKPLNFGELVRLLEDEIGFEPVVEVAVEIRGRLQRTADGLFLEASQTGQRFPMEEAKGAGAGPPENELIEASGVLVNPKSAGALVLRNWRPVSPSAR